MNPRSWIGILATAAAAFVALNLWQWQSSASDELSAGEITDRFSVLWGHDDDTWRKNSFLGIRTLQNPLDVWVTFEIIHEVKPDVIVETGTHHGGSAALWAMFLEHVNPEGRVITIDVEDESAEARELPISRRRVDYLIGSSTDGDRPHCQRLSAAKAAAAVARIPIQLREFTGRSHRGLADRGASAGLD